MLKQLYIKNFTLIDTLDIHFNPGFSVITGETGAGKSIILGAINLLLGQRADTKSIKANASKCIIEAHFDVSKYDMQSFFTENDIDFDATDCILRRELNSSGKTRAFINDVPVSLNTIRILGQQLIDIHSQHQNLLLNEEDFQLNVVDIIAKDKDILAAYKEYFKNYREAHRNVEQLRCEIEENRKNEDYLRFQLKELTEAQLKKGMQEELELESEKLNHVEEIKNALYSVENTLNAAEQDNSVIDKLKEASRTIDGITNIFPEIKDIAGRIESCYIELKDISQDINSEAGGIDFDQSRLEQINSKLDKIYSLEQKYHLTDVDELIKLQTDIEKQLSKIDNSDEELEKLEIKEKELFDQCCKLASEITDVREKAARTIEKNMLNFLTPLGIPNARFIVEIKQKELCADGHDSISFLFSANTSRNNRKYCRLQSMSDYTRIDKGGSRGADSHYPGRQRVYHSDNIISLDP